MKKIFSIIKRYKKLEQECQKQLLFYRLLTEWLYLETSQRSIAEYFIQRDYRNVAVYGMKELGDLLVKDLQNNDINVVCGIDKNAKYIIQNIPMFTNANEIPDVDVIIVTAVSYYDEIKGDVEKMINVPIVSLLDVVTELSDTII